MSSLFKFKQFNVDQAGSSMKINTDGVLLGALAEKEIVNRILDIGTGTGVIALMMAQRYPNALIDAIEIDGQSSLLAERNFKNSVFASRIMNYHISLQDFDSLPEYDIIISNPPFFTNALKNPDHRKSSARHTSFEFYDQLVNKASKLLVNDGSLHLVLPPEVAEFVIKKAGDPFLFKHKKTIKLKSFTESEPFREIITLVKTHSNITTEYSELTLYHAKGIYSIDYKKVLKPFFINF